jgi:hypothetical protein
MMQLAKEGPQYLTMFLQMERVELTPIITRFMDAKIKCV